MFVGERIEKKRFPKYHVQKSSLLRGAIWTTTTANHSNLSLSSPVHEPKNIITNEGTGILNYISKIQKQ
jgi:hypothetical protein